jgi:hypothetical protein
VAGNQPRLERRVRRDFPGPGSADSVLQLLAELPRRAGYDPEALASERVRAAIVLLADGDAGRLRQEIDLALEDWRDVLAAAGLADEDWPARLDQELGPDAGTTVLWRPVGPEELELVRQSGWRRWPPRLPGQPIFYPVLNEEYAIKIARDWNVPASGSGYVTRFRVRSDFLTRYPAQQVGGKTILELWVPAEDLDELNASIVGQIEVIHEFTRDNLNIETDHHR